MPSFDSYIGIDYSGAQTLAASLKGLRSLAAFLKPYLMPSERAVAQVEGWILGVADYA